MKISKLFHWLYAILMLLPFAFFVPSVLYYAFNDNATMQAVEVPKTETIAVDFNQKLELISEYRTVNISADSHFILNTTAYQFNLNGVYNGSIDRNYEVYISNYFNLINNHLHYFRFFDFENNALRFHIWGDNQQLNVVEGSSSFIFNSGSFSNYRLFFQINANFNGSLDYSFYLNIFDLTQMFGSGNEPTMAEFDSMFTSDYYDYIQSQPMQVTYETGETEQLVENTSIINYAWESIWDLPLFSWTKITFVSVPFSYLTGIFGISVSNSLNYVFGYFVTISIVWLVFDLLLYVPMLAHNWIDKARIE